MKLLNGLNHFQRQNLYNTCSLIIEGLPPAAVRELFSGEEKDLNKILRIMIEQVYHLMNFGGTVESENVDYLDNFAEGIHDQLLRLNYNYFKTNVLNNFMQNARNLEWGNLVQLYERVAFLCQRGSGKSYEFCYAFPLWRMYTYNRISEFNKHDLDNRLRQETCLITNETKLGRVHMERIVEEIKFNPVLCEKLNAGGKGSLGVDGITTTTGSKLHLRSYGGFIRGIHVGSCVVDDFVDESSMYSKDQRDKFREQFKGAITNIVEEFGSLIVSGTPFHESDLYADLKKDPMFAVFEYPGILPDGQLLAPDRFSYEHLKAKQEADGSVVFAREVLVSPISDAASLFPYEILRRSIEDTQKLTLTSNIDLFPIKFKRVVIGCDFAISGKIGADFTVYTVWGKTDMGVYYLVNIWKKQGATHNEQLYMLSALDSKYRPNKIICEANNFQSILSSLARQQGLTNIETFTTTSSNKKDLKSGLPSLAAIFERGEIKIPYGDKYSREVADWLMSEFNSMTFNQDRGTLESVSEHDDGVMSTFMAINNLREGVQEFKAYMI